MKTAFFIAKRLAASSQKSFTKMVVTIAIISLAFSIAVIIISSSIIDGFKSEINNKIFGFWGHIHITDASNLRDFDLRPISIDSLYYSKLKNIRTVEYNGKENNLESLTNRAVEDYISTKGGVESTNPYIIMPCLIETKTEMIAGLFKGIGFDVDYGKMNRFLVSGEALSEKDSSNQILISKIISDKLNIQSGKKIIVSFIKDNVKLKRLFVVKGVYNTGLEEYDKRFIVGHAQMLQELLNWSKSEYSGIEVFAEHKEDIKILNDYIYANILPSSIYSETVEEKFPNIFEWLKLQDINEKVIFQLMGVVAMINLITVLLILILERTKMVGILKSIGGSNWTIRSIFIFQACFILLIGLLLGNFLGLGFCFFQKSTSLLKLDEQNYYLSVVPIKINWLKILIINSLAFLVCLITLIIPSILVSKIKPVTALKFD